MNAKKIPDITLERYLLNELPSERMAHIAALIRDDPFIKKRLREIEKTSASILRRYAPETIVPGIIERASLPPRRKERGSRVPVARVLAPSLAAAVIVSLVIFIPLMKSGRDTVINRNGEVTRIKGPGSELYIYRKKRNSAELLVNNRRVRERDLLQIAYYSADDDHGVVLSLDGRGTVTLHYPRSASAATRIEKNRKILIPSSYELDDAPGFERFIFVTSKRDIDVTRVLNAARKIAAAPESAKKGELTIDIPCRQTSVVLLKEQ